MTLREKIEATLQAAGDHKQVRRWAIGGALLLAAGCVGQEQDGGVAAEAASLTSPRNICTGALKLIIRQPLMVVSSDRHDIYVDDHDVYLFAPEGFTSFEAGQLYGSAMAHSAARLTAEEIMSSPPGFISAGVRALEADGVIGVCHMAWSSVTDATTGEVFEW